jgi:hypothetical protein
VYVELPSEGTAFSGGDSFGVIESVKTASDVYAPVSGEVIAANTSATADPKKVRTSQALVKKKCACACQLSPPPPLATRSRCVHCHWIAAALSTLL